MPIRDIVLTAGILGLLPLCLARPWIGVLMWSWLGYMNPHRLTWGFASELPFAQLVAICTLAGLLLTKDKKPIPWVRETYLLVALWIMFTITTFFAFYPDEAWEQFDKVSKVLLFTFVTLKLFQDRTRLRYLFLVIALSIGFYGAKGGVWALLTGGMHRVYGPDRSFLGSNNSIGLALNMVLPILYMLWQDEPRRWLRNVLRFTFCMSIVGVVFTYSRGGFLGLIVVLAALFFRPTKRALGGLTVALALGLLFLMLGSPFLPDQWWQRMGTIYTYDQDTSAVSRLTAWKVAFQLAVNRPFLGGGFWVLPHYEIFQLYSGSDSDASYSAHSIYFSILGDHGFVALGLFVFLLLSCVGSLARLRRLARRSESAAWVGTPARMLQASFLAYMVSGAFLTEAYFDLFYHLVSVVILLKVLVSQEAPTRAAPAAATPVRTPVKAMPVAVIRPVRKAPPLPIRNRRLPSQWRPR